MVSTCPNCGCYRPDQIVLHHPERLVCPVCGFTRSFHPMPLFLITGASGVGKSSACRELFLKESDYLVLESDILWNDFYNTPQDQYRLYRETWLRMCRNISQIGKPVVLCGCCEPSQFTNCIESRYFSSLYFLACICQPQELERRLRQGRGISNTEFIQTSLNFNQWFYEHSAEAPLPITLLDTTNLTVSETAEQIDRWIQNKMIRLDT